VKGDKVGTMLCEGTYSMSSSNADKVSVNSSASELDSASISLALLSCLVYLDASVLVMICRQRDTRYRGLTEVEKFVAGVSLVFVFCLSVIGCGLWLINIIILFLRQKGAHE